MASPGTHIGSYRLVRLLGEGAMGAVYEAEHTLMDRRAAIKLLHSEVLEERRSVQRFVNEARALNRVRHPGLVEILELGELPDGAPYLVMELLIGEPLSTRIARTKTWEPPLAIEIARQVAAAMTAAHVQGIVHRDLKPSNLMLLAEAEPAPPRVKVLDFGIAKLGPTRRTPKSSDPLTRSQAVLGTAEYMAPEQCRDARGVDAQADVYALGVILYELLAGQRPFAAETPLEVMLLHMQAPVPLLKSHGPALGDALASLVHRMLAKAPHERPTMAEVAEQLASDAVQRPQQARTVDEPLSSTSPIDGVRITPKTASSKTRRPAPWILLAAASLAPLVIGSGMFLRERQRTRASTDGRKPPPPKLPIAAPQKLERPPVDAGVDTRVAPPSDTLASPLRAPSLLPAPAAKPTVQPNVSPSPRPPRQPPASSSPSVLFKDKDPEGF